MISRLLLLLWILISLPVGADTQVAADRSMRLTVKPVLCVTDRASPGCRMSFLVIWESVDTGYYCLFNDFGAAPVRCWSDERAGRVEDERVVLGDFRYWMQEDGSERRIVAVTVEVLRMDNDDRRRNRRNRHVWDLN